MCSYLLRIFLLTFFSLTLISCISSYNSKARSAHEAFHRGEYENAVALIEKVKPAPRDKLLHLLDRGMILHGAGRYKESNAALTEAEDLADALSSKSISREVGGTLWSEEATAYAGEKYEVAMIPVVRMLNYIMLDDWDGALVEVRRIYYVAEKKYGHVRAFDNAFAIYLSAIIWETLGYINDALIDYRRLGEEKKELPYYGLDLKKISREINLPVALPEKGSRAWEASDGYRKEKGQLIVILENGRSPEFVAETVSTGLFSVSLPQVMEFPPVIQYANVKVDGINAGSTYPFYNIAEDIFGALKERSKRSFIRKMIKLSVQTGLYVAGAQLAEQEETESKIAGAALIFLGISMSAAEKADERSWRTLPADLQIGRFYLSPGTHEVEIVPVGGGAPIIKTAEVTKERPEVILARYTEGPAVARRVREKPPPHIAKANEQEQSLSEELTKRPRDGLLKIELASARIEAGNYHVEDLLKEAMREGGDKQEGIKLLVIVKMLKGEYGVARNWALEDRGLEGMDFYADAASYLLGDTDKPPSANDITLTHEEGLINAFNYFVVGLIREKEKNYDEAATEFADAYKYGLVGEQVVRKFTENYKKTDDDFKKSKEGIEILSEFSDNYLPQLEY